MPSQMAFTWKTDSVPLTSFATSTSGWPLGDCPAGTKHTPSDPRSPALPLDGSAAKLRLFRYPSKLGEAGLSTQKANRPPIRSATPKTYWRPATTPTVTPSGSGPFDRLRLSRVLLVWLALKYSGYVDAVTCSSRSPESHTRLPSAAQMVKPRPPKDTMRSTSPSPSRSPRSLRICRRPSRALPRSQSRPGNTCLSSVTPETVVPSTKLPHSRASPSLAVT